MSTPCHRFLGMPNYGRAAMNAARGFFRASRDMSTVVKYHPTSSLLAANFNAIWCGALNHVHEGRPLQYFAMLHDDVAPEDFWLDKLIEELEAQDLDILGTVVPIKDRRGMTSLALQTSNDPWLGFCRLSMTDVFRLPSTFTSADLGKPLLLNTGCWVMRWNQDICKQLYFTVKDEIVYNTANNRFQALCEPEDWNFSRQAHGLGLKIGATRKVQILHHGEYTYHNAEPWGTHEFDREFLKASPVPDVDRDGFRFPHDVDGWLSYDEGKALWRLAKGKRVLEIGSYCGRSTICMAQVAEYVMAVDPFDGRATDTPRPTADAFIANVNRYDVGQRIVMLNGTASNVDADDGQFDLIFIDGDHSYEAVRNDIANSVPLLAPGGLLAFHDFRGAPSPFGGRWDPGVNQAVKELLANGGELLFTEDSLAVVRPPALIPQEV